MLLVLLSLSCVRFTRPELGLHVDPTEQGLACGGVLAAYCCLCYELGLHVDPAEHGFVCGWGVAAYCCLCHE